MARKLKVFRTSIGFHDAYVAAPSQKAALEAWGSGSNLFGTGLAEQVTDPELIKGPLEKPGEVIKVKRGSEQEHLAALPKTSSPRPAAKRTTQPTPALSRPRRTALDRAERELSAAEIARDKEIDAFDEQIRDLQERRRMAIDRHRTKIDRAENKRSEEADRYDAAIERWRNQ